MRLSALAIFRLLMRSATRDRDDIYKSIKKEELMRRINFQFMIVSIIIVIFSVPGYAKDQEKPNEHIDGYTGPIQAPIPAQFRHLFRLNSGSHSAPIRAPSNV